MCWFEPDPTIWKIGPPELPGNAAQSLSQTSGRAEVIRQAGSIVKTVRGLSTGKPALCIPAKVLGSGNFAVSSAKPKV
jgi:hypothetical protein